ncbi:hypothetical protein BPA30113_05985 [Burkholderia paludis]|uniref:Rap1a immunity protein domain-containing protein n=1 Tax=Burkholderia paludis TaxID=1506587 RepID=A0A6P2QZH7_9BURK|nr:MULTISPECIES: Rap1a/Tai family immunity protein [Burkholderia]CAB3773234.1 hypothetical protein LMG30113_07032 [Burkholderia paludis]VWC25719.1 hypothetical protein BPA30113_05985 [Burkholderia paludis]
MPGLRFRRICERHPVGVLSLRHMFVFVSLSASAAVASATKVPRVDGVRLLDGMSRTDITPYADAERHAATGYLAGVADATAGKDWCGNARIKPGEVGLDVLDTLRKLPREALKASATSLVVGILRHKYPCR